MTFLCFDKFNSGSQFCNHIRLTKALSITHKDFDTLYCFEPNFIKLDERSL